MHFDSYAFNAPNHVQPLAWHTEDVDGAASKANLQINKDKVRDLGAYVSGLLLFKGCQSWPLSLCVLFAVRGNTDHGLVVESGGDTTRMKFDHMHGHMILMWTIRAGYYAKSS